MNATMKRRIVQYIAGLLLMSLAVVLSKRSGLGLSPLSTTPAAFSAVTGISLGTTTIIYQIICLIVIIFVTKKITVKAVLTLCIAFAFGFMIDFFMLFIGPAGESIAVKLIMILSGIVVSALGIVMIVGTDLMLPSPDAMLRSISVVYKKSYPLIKNTGDIFFVVLAVIIELALTGKLTSVGVGTVLSAVLTGRMVKLFTKLFPALSLMSKPSE